MNTIINGLIHGYELDLPKEYLSPQEVSYVEFIENSEINSGIRPSADLMMREFPELRISDDTLLSELDTRVYISNFLKKRENLRQSQLLMTLASQVAQTGVTAEIVDQISRQHVTMDDHEDTIATPEAFRKHYDLKKTKPEGIVTNIKAIDDRVGGIPYGTVLTIAGFTSHGKSLLANNIAYHNAMKLKYNFCILSLEVPKEQLLANLLVRHSKEPEFSEFPKITAQAIEKGRLSAEQEDFVFNVLLPDFYDVEKHGIIKIFDESDIKDTKMTTMKELLLKADDECREKTGIGIDSVVVDHVQLLKFDTGTKDSEMSAINKAVSWFHKLAQDFRVVDGELQQVSIVLLSQINRDGFKKAQKHKGAYNLTALADANEIERSSQCILTVYMDQENKLSKEMLVCMLKNRAGECLTDPEAVFCDPASYIAGDGMADNFAEGIELGDLEDVFGNGGSIADLL